MLIVNHGSGICRVGFSGYDAPRAMFPSVFGRFVMLGITGRHGPEGLPQVRRHPFRGAEAVSQGPDCSFGP